MADNIILTPQTYVRGVLMNLGGYLSVCRNMSKQYSKEYGKEPGKVGDTISVKKPQRFEVTDGLEYQPRPLQGTKVNITVGDVTGVHFDWDSVEKTLDVEDAQENYFKPAAIALASKINGRAAKYIAQNTFNAVGTAGTTASDIDTYLSAGDLIVDQGLPPEEELSLILNRKMSSKYVVGQSTFFNPSDTNSKMIQRGEIVDKTLGYRIERDQTLYVHKVGPLGGTPLTNGNANTADGGNNGTMRLSTKGWTAAAASRLLKGDDFTIDGINSVHPQTKDDTGDLQQFTVLEDFSSDGAGDGSILVAPAITPSGQQQNVTAAPVDGTAITVRGAAGTKSPQGLLLHKNAYAFVSLPLATPKSGKGVMYSAMEQDPQTGLWLALVQFFDGKNRVEGTRFDCLTGFGTLYREMACRIYN